MLRVFQAPQAFTQTLAMAHGHSPQQAQKPTSHTSQVCSMTRVALYMTRLCLSYLTKFYLPHGANHNWVVNIMSMMCIHCIRAQLWSFSPEGQGPGFKSTSISYQSTPISYFHVYVSCTCTAPVCRQIFCSKLYLLVSNRDTAHVLNLHCAEMC